MLSQKFYDLCMDADRDASDSDLEKLSFLLDSVAEMAWLRDLLNQDAPRLAGRFAVDTHPRAGLAALLLCTDLQNSDGYAGRLSSLIARNKETALQTPATTIERRTARSGKTSTSNRQRIDALPPAQRLYELISIVDCVGTAQQQRMVVNVLQNFRSDVLDAAALVQDAPRVAAQLSRFTPLLTHGCDPITYHSWFVDGQDEIDQCLRTCHGVLHSIAQAVRDLFAQFGAVPEISKDEWHQLRKSDSVPKQFAIQRVGPANGQYVFMWSSESRTGFQFTRALSDAAIDMDKPLLEAIMPHGISSEVSLSHLIVCVACDATQAKNLVEQDARQWSSDYYRPGELSAHMDFAQRQDLFLLDTDERPRAVLVWSR